MIVLAAVRGRRRHRRRRRRRRRYKVRAIFDNAGFVIPGEDVKVAGVKVGTIDSLDVTDDNKAAVVLEITDPGYQDFRNDAECTVRPQSLIGERFVECELTQARAAGTEPPPKLDKIEDGPGKGQYLLPVENTSQVGRPRPDQQHHARARPRSGCRSSSTTSASASPAAGEDLKDVIRRADPALKEIDKVLKILARQNDTLAAAGGRLGHDPGAAGARAPARRAARSTTRARSRGRPPSGASRSRPTSSGCRRSWTSSRRRWCASARSADQMTPVFTDLGAVAPDINRMILALGPFSKAAIPALESLGEAADRGTPAVKAALPVVTRPAPARRGGEARRRQRPQAARVAARDTGGIERAMDYIFFQSRRASTGSTRSATTCAPR